MSSLKKHLKIAIYSGEIPSSSFIEQLITGVSGVHHVFLFGKIRKKSNYPILNSNIKVFGTSTSKFGAIFQTIVRSLVLLLLFPKRIVVLRTRIRKQQSFYQKRQSWIKITPVLLHLPDIFHVQWAKDLEYWLFLKDAFGVKIVLSLRGAHINYSPIANEELANSYKENFPKVDAFHAVSDAIGIEAQKYGASKEKISKIHSLLPSCVFELYSIPTEKNNEKVKIVSVGRHHWIKGYETALDACAILKHLNIPFSYTIIAGSQVPEVLIYKRKELDLQEEVVFIDTLSQQKVFEIMQSHDALVLPSLKEGLANVVLEAMAMGLPVISADCGGMPEVITHGHTGWLFLTLDAASLADTLQLFTNISIENKRLVVRKAYDFVKKEFNTEHKIKEFLEFYKINSQ